FCRETIKTIPLAEWTAGDLPECRRGPSWHLRPGERYGRRTVVERTEVRQYVAPGGSVALYSMYRVRCEVCGDHQVAYGKDLVACERTGRADTCRSCALREAWSDPERRERVTEAAEAAQEAVEARSEEHASELQA